MIRSDGIVIVSTDARRFPCDPIGRIVMVVAGDRDVFQRTDQSNEAKRSPVRQVFGEHDAKPRRMVGC